MADNTTLSAGSADGDTYASDDISGVKYQRVKLIIGADGTNDGDVADGNPLPVDDAGGSLTVDGTVTANLSATDNEVLDNIQTAVQTIDNIVLVEDAQHSSGASGVMPLAVRNDTLAELAGTDGDYAPLQVNASGALFVQEGAAMDVSAATVTVDNGGTFATQVDGDALAALQLIDDPVFADDAAFTTGSSKVSMAGAIRDDSLSTLTAVEADAVPLRVNSTGALHVTGGGGGTEYTEDVATANPIVGTATVMERDDALGTLTPIEGDWAAMRCSAEGALWVQEFNSDAILADTASMDTNLGTLAGAVSGSEMQVDLVSANVTNAGTFATQVDGDALTALQLIDNIVSVDDAAYTLGSGSGVMMMGFAGTQSVDANDSAALACDTDGALHVSDGGNTLTVDGTVTANAGTNLNTSALALESGGNLADIETNTDFGATTGNGTASGALRVTVASDTTGVLSVDDNAGSLTVDNAGTFATQNTAQPSTATGCTSYYDADLDETAIAADAGAVGIYAITAFNTTAAPLFLQLFNVAVGSVSVGSTTPTNQFVIPGNADSDGAGFTVSFPMPLIYDTALTVACTTNSEGNSAPGAGACIVNIIHST